MSQSERRILVTGGAGFIGSNFVNFVLAKRPNWQVVNLDALTYAGNLANLTEAADNARYEFVHADIRDRQAVVNALTGCDSVVHFAAESHVDRSIADASPFISTNVLGTQVMLDACRETGTIERFVHIGTDEVYGELPLDRPDLLFTEQSPLKPNSPYSASKASADLLALAFEQTFGLPVMVTRCSNNFGPKQYPEKIIPLFVTNLIDSLKVPLYGDGLNVRDWLHVTDHCEAVLAVLERGRVGEVYNIGANNEHSNVNLTHTILELLGCTKEMILPVEDRLGHDRRYAIDSSRIKAELGWQATLSAWPDALAATVNWYKENQSWWRPLKSKAAQGVA